MVWVSIICFTWSSLYSRDEFSAPSVTAQGQPGLPQPIGYVNDFANVIAPEQEAAIGRIIEEVRTKSGGEIVVVTMATLQGRTLDELALRIGREWRIGQKGEPGDSARNTGVVVLVIPRETSDDGRGHVKIETGLGTTTFITAAEAGRIAGAADRVRFFHPDLHAELISELRWSPASLVNTPRTSSRNWNASPSGSPTAV